MRVGWTTIKVSNETRDRLKSIGRKGETYNDVIVLLLDHKPKRWRPLRDVE